jgi:hypothetical protein
VKCPFRPEDESRRPTAKKARVAQAAASGSRRKVLGSGRKAKSSHGGRKAKPSRKEEDWEGHVSSGRFTRIDKFHANIASLGRTVHNVETRMATGLCFAMVLAQALYHATGGDMPSAELYLREMGELHLIPPGWVPDQLECESEVIGWLRLLPLGMEESGKEDDSDEEEGVVIRRSRSPTSVRIINWSQSVRRSPSAAAGGSDKMCKALGALMTGKSSYACPGGVIEHY